jgi:peptidyl-prolyl cis-trans isomerase SurA
MRLREIALLLAGAAAVATMPVIAQEAGNGGIVGANENVTVLGQVDPAVRKATAIVNGAVVTDTDVEQRLNLVLAANGGGTIGEEERTRLRLQVLRNLIDEKLQIQEAEENDIKLQEAEVDQAFGRVAQNFRQNPQAFDRYLRERGSSATTMKQQIRAELAWSRLLRRRIEPFVNVGDEEVQAVIQRLEAQKGQEQFRVGEIFLSATPENEAQIMENARRIVAQVRQGASFVAYARQFSEASTAAVGGDLGYVLPAQLPQALQPVLTTLEKGQVSDPIRVPGGVTIVALVDKRRALTADPADAVLNLKQLSIAFKPGTTQAQASGIVKTLQERTTNMGGCGRADAVGQELGAEVVANDQVRIRDLPAPLQSLMQQLQVGQATPPFGSQREGVRVLVLCGRDDPQQQAGPSFDEVYAQINDERVNRAARRYLRDLRRDAVVDYR